MAALTPEEICTKADCCVPTDQEFKSWVSILLCALIQGGGTGGGCGFMLLCDPETGDPVLVYAPCGGDAPITLVAYNLDGTAYTGDISALVSCSGGGGGDVTEATWLPLSSVDASTLSSGSYTALLVDTHGKLYIEVYNASDQAIVVSMDGGVTAHKVVSANGTWKIEPGSQNKKLSHSISVKLLTSDAAAGVVYASSYY